MTPSSGRGERRHIVLHAHFYQPPREDPDFDTVEQEESARPFHDWNERITQECYRAVVAARVHGPDGRIAGVVNTLEWISFNVGPTLFEWLERHAADTTRRIIQADRASVARLGHGNAIAHPYHHVILPLASRRDKVTEVRWGIMDFRRRFGREPEGMWLPETAVDDETLDVLAQEGIRFTVLAPHQVHGAPPNGHPGRYTTANGRSIALFPYHGDIAHGIAFGGLVRNADHWLDALWGVKAARRRTPAATDVIADEPPHPLLVSAATDGETYGHHHKFAELALARVLERSRVKGGHLDNFASFLAQHPARHEVTLVAPSSWSCSHGVERWRSDCGCRVDGHAAPSQAWRGPLRTGLEALAARLHARFESEGREYFEDPWAARDAYGAVAGRSDLMVDVAFLEAHRRREWKGAEILRAFALLEMERDALRMFTSCAWFFDDIGGLEPRQVLRYAQRALHLSGERHLHEEALLAILEDGHSNDRTVGTGADVYRSILPRFPAAFRAAAAARALEEFGLVDLVPIGRRQVEVGTFEIGALGVTGSAGLYHVSSRTENAGQFRVDLVSRTAGDLVIEVEALDWPNRPTATLHLADLPERARLDVRRAMRDALLASCLSADELRELASGAAPLLTLAAGALTRAVNALTAQPHDAAAITAVETRLDLFEQMESPIPFDAQTHFWDAWESLPAAQRAPLHGLATRLGFSVD